MRNVSPRHEVCTVDPCFDLPLAPVGFTDEFNDWLDSKETEPSDLELDSMFAFAAPQFTLNLSGWNDGAIFHLIALADSVGDAVISDAAATELLKRIRNSAA